MTFKKATKSQAKLRLALIGTSGSGKTYSALSIARGLGSRIAVIDTERGSASKYADLVDFDVLELTEFDPRNYISAINEAAAEGYEVLIIDSLSHAWIGRGGALELVDRAAKRSQSNNSFAAWRDVTPLHNALIDAIVSAPLHVIATLRAKTEYVLEKDDKGRTAPRKVGMAPVQRAGLEYEFDVVGDMDNENNLIVSKTRYIPLTGKVVPKPDGRLGAELKAWLSDGEPAPVAAQKPAAQPAPQSITPPSQLEQPDASEYVSPVESDPLRLLPQSLGELKRQVIVENKWVQGGQRHWDNLISLLKSEGEITDAMQLNDDFPAMFLAIQKHYKAKEAQQQAAS
jgi:hypothetical protein